MNTREVKKVLNGKHTLEGAGIPIIRVFGYHDIYDLDPFLMLDDFSSDNPEDYAKGVPLHPHRGQEIMTYLIEGDIEHKDTLGNTGQLKDGMLQWMTAGSGIMHEEWPKVGATGKQVGFVCWVNMPAKDKMVNPKYLNINPDAMKIVESDKVKVKVVLGEHKGRVANTTDYVKITFLDVELDANTSYEIDMPKDDRVIAYIMEGDAEWGNSKEKVEGKAAILFEDNGGKVVVKSGSKGARFVLLGGKPIGEEIAWYGPIVMNTNAELRTAFKELEAGTFIKKSD